MRILRDSLILVGIFAVSWYLFSLQEVSDDPLDVNLISVETEKEIGDILFESQIQSGSNGPILVDSYCDSILSDIKNTLVENMDTCFYDYEIYVLDNSDINAFTIPGGKIFFFKGILDKMESAEECAAVMAHEIGHNEKRHLIKRMMTSFGLSAILGGNDVVISDILSQLGIFKYARMQEEEADEFSFDLLIQSHIDPSYFGTIMSKLISEEENAMLDIEIINTHPDTEARMREAYNQVLPEDFEEEKLPIDWGVFLDELE